MSVTVARVLGLSGAVGLGACTVAVPVGVDPIVPQWVGYNIDGEGSGSPDDEDCDGTQANVGPELPELCDRIDNDCDGEIDEGSACFRQETFWQDGDVDVMLVVDPRDEASEAVAKLQFALLPLVEPLVGPGRVARFGVLSMDAEDPMHRGRLVPMEDGDPYADSAWDDAAKISTELSAAIDAIDAPAGMVGARFVTDRAVRLPPEANHGFPRDGEFLALVYVTTTDDLSMPGSAVLAHNLDVAVGPGQWSASMILQPGVEDCTGKLAPEQEGASLVDLWEKGTGGLLLSHCLDSYRWFAESLGAELAAQGQTESWTLAEAPVPGSVQVVVRAGVDVVPVPAYEVQVDGLTVSVTEAPLPGAEITIAYEVDPS